ncbi:amino acid ABC transporter permease [Streptosporangium oxazolinicum]|uniref:Amino acid ABC transporter permease n=1 Tax=Streptosporangium oxazolinicum TaxID=909287 RepID=A0ABP8BN98_9ACTN
MAHTAKPTDPAAAPLADAGEPPPIRAIPVRHYGRWLAAAAVLFLLAGLVNSLIRNPNIGWPTIGEYLFKRVILDGLVTTVWLTAAAMAIGMVGGTIVAIMRLSSNPVLSVASWTFIWLFRGTPLLVQILFWGFFGIFYAELELGIPFTDLVLWSAPTNQVITPMVAALLALGLNEVAYAAEIIRSGIQSVDHGQTEAAHSLGMSPLQTMRRIILPQAMRVIVPPMGNETINMLKTTALVSVIAAAEMMTQIQRIYSQNYQTIPLLIVASIWYLVLTSLLSIPQAYMERRYGRGAGRGSGALRRLVGGTR